MLLYSCRVQSAGGKMPPFRNLKFAAPNASNLAVCNLHDPWSVMVAECDARRGAEQSTNARDDGGMVADDLPILYTKRGCPWCDEAVEFLDGHGIGYKLREVSADANALAEMRQKSGQTKAPTLDWRGKILADFGVDELVPLLRKQNVKLEDS
jgi:glutaredoxin 3